MTDQSFAAVRYVGIVVVPVASGCKAGLPVRGPAHVALQLSDSHHAACGASRLRLAPSSFNVAAINCSARVRR